MAHPSFLDLIITQPVLFGSNYNISSMCLLYMHFKLLFYFNRGGFELQRTGRSPELCDGFQAHLSCSAAQLVLDVVKKFPSKVQLEEVPRQNSWPTQFQENGPTYDNIGRFFFARDVQRCVVCSFPLIHICFIHMLFLI